MSVSCTLPANDRFDVQLTYDKFTNGKVDGTISYKLYGFPYTDQLTLDPAKTQGVGLRCGMKVAQAGAIRFSAVAAYLPETKGDLAYTYREDYGGQWDTSRRTWTFKHSFLAVGGQATWRLPADLGFGLEYRDEKLKYAYRSMNESTSLGRVWLRAHLGYTWTYPGPNWSMGLAFAMPLSKPSSPDLSDPATGDKDLLRALAPSQSLGVYVGGRF